MGSKRLHPPSNWKITWKNDENTQKNEKTRKNEKNEKSEKKH